MCKFNQSSVGIGVCMCVSHHQLNFQQTATCVCNGSALGSAITGAPRDLYVFVLIITLPSTATYVCMYVYVYKHR